METRAGNGHRPELEKFYNDLRTVVADGEELLKASAGTVRERARMATQKGEQLLRDKPYQSVGVAFGVGVLVGIVAAGMLSRDECDDD